MLYIYKMVKTRKRRTRRGGVLSRPSRRRRRRTLKRSYSLPSSFRPHHTSYLAATQPLVEEPPPPAPIRLTRASTAKRGGRKHRQKRRNQKGGNLIIRLDRTNNTFRIGDATNGVGMFELAAVFTLLGLRQGAQAATAVGTTLGDGLFEHRRRTPTRWFGGAEADINGALNRALQWIQDEVRTAAGARPRWRGVGKDAVVPTAARQAAMRSFGVGAGGGGGATQDARNAEVLFVPQAFESMFTVGAAGAAGGAAGGAAAPPIAAMTAARNWRGPAPRINTAGGGRGGEGRSRRNGYPRYSPRANWAIDP